MISANLLFTAPVGYSLGSISHSRNDFISVVVPSRKCAVPCAYCTLALFILRRLFCIIATNPINKEQQLAVSPVHDLKALHFLEKIIGETA